jgi:hypothetical protein
MSAFIQRLLLAVVCVLILYAVLPAFARVVGFPLSGDVLTILKVCIAGLAVLYVGWGKTPFGPA